MGVLRVFLAISVLDWHFRFSEMTVFPYSFAAVLCFYIISGFYMSLIIAEKYGTSDNGLRRFYINRALRLYPAWLAVLFVAIVLGKFGLVPLPSTFRFHSEMDLSDRLVLIFNQLLIFPGVFIANVSPNPGPQPPHVLIYGQMYTVGLEILFYLVAPFIVTQRFRFLLAITALAAALHYGFGQWGLPRRPWQYEFLPGILFFFLLGALAYRLWLKVKKLSYPRSVGLLALPLLLGYCSLISVSSTHDHTNSPGMFGLYALVVVLIPFLFNATTRAEWQVKPTIIAKWDERIGNLSYPMYAVHYLIGDVVGVSPGSTDHSRNLIVLFGVVGASIAISVLIEHPIERLRRKVAGKYTAEPTSPRVGV